MALFDTLAPRIMRDLQRDIPGWGELDSAACVGNAGHESGGFRYLQEIKPVVPGSRGGFGWFQWTGPRRRAYEAFCAALRLDPTSYEANYGFLLEELRTSEKHTVPAVARAVGLEDKVVAFERAFERAGVKHYQSRLQYAQRALEAARGGVVPRPTPRPAPKPKVPEAVKTHGPLVGLLLAVAAAIGAVVEPVRDWFLKLFGG